jgi:cytochrome c biogenesis protein CcdA
MFPKSFGNSVQLYGKGFVVSGLIFASIALVFTLLGAVTLVLSKVRPDYQPTMNFFIPALVFISICLVYFVVAFFRLVGMRK